MERPAVSVVVASLGRPADLARCVTALGQLRYRPLEVVVVACDAGRAALGGAGRPWLRILPNSAEGIAAARNTGIAAAGGAIVAFIDDDAVPEPTWLDHLVDAMEETGAQAATGFVRGRNGISFQWRGRAVRRDAFIETLPDRGHAAFTVPPDAGVAMMEGTNMAVRRDTLVALGGFDPAYRFFLDDADMAVRLHHAGYQTAIAPLAQVHHGFAASPRRRHDRMPTDLFDNGRSLAIFVRAHLDEARAPEVIAQHREAERRRLIRCMIQGRGEPRDVRRLLARFDQGVEEGRGATFGAERALPGPRWETAFRRDAPARVRVLAGRAWSASALRAEAARMAQRGEVASIFLLSPTALYHRVRYARDGYWEQTGGLFGRADRSEPLFRLRTFSRRLAEEAARVAKVRGIPESPT